MHLILREKCHVDFKLDTLKYALFDVTVKITIKILDGSNTSNFHQIMIFSSNKEKIECVISTSLWFTPSLHLFYACRSHMYGSHTLCVLI
jgi:hypothetical protein